MNLPINVFLMFITGLLSVAIIWLIYLKRIEALGLIALLVGMLFCSILWLVNGQMTTESEIALLFGIFMMVIITSVRHRTGIKNIVKGWFGHD